jgi:hypothetical protein
MATERKPITKPAIALKMRLSASHSDSKSAIEKRAAEIFLNRVEAGIPGDALADWLQAEQEMTTKSLAS